MNTYKIIITGEAEIEADSQETAEAIVARNAADYIELETVTLCGNCGRPATQLEDGHNRCDRCANL